MRCPEENSTLRQERQDAPALRGHPFHHHIIPSPTLLSYCPRRYSHHWTQLSRASAPRLYNSLFPSRIGHAVGVKRLRCGLFFFFTLCAELCVCFFVSWLQLLSKGESSRGQTRFLVPYLGFCSFVFFFCELPDLGRERQRERERGGDMHDMYT